MEWLIEDALPPVLLANRLAADWARAAPTLAQALQYGDVRVVASDPRDTLATPAESWLLRRAGYQPTAEVPLGSGWAALLAPAGQDPVWLAHPCHLHVTQQGITLLDPALLSLTADEQASLLESIEADLAAAGVRCERLESGTWRWILPTHWTPYGPTPACATGEEVQHWWPQHAGARGWRQLLNLIQMVWHDHPVNQARSARGLPPVNSVWLHGGASAAALPTAAEARVACHDTRLAPYQRQGDWAGWLAALAELDQQLAPQAARWRAGDVGLSWVLTGADRWLELRSRPRNSWTRWWPRRPRADWAKALSASPTQA